MDIHRKYQLVAAAVGLPLLLVFYFGLQGVYRWEYDNVYQPACERVCRSKSLGFGDVTRPARRDSGLARCRCYGGGEWKTFGVRGYSDNAWIDWVFTSGIWLALGLVLCCAALIIALGVLQVRGARGGDGQGRG